MDFSTVRTRLEENQIRYTVMELSNNAKIIVSEYGGRIFGPFIDDGNSLCWINPCFKTKESFGDFLILKEWNLGGDRIWLAPEMQYNVPDQTDFWGSYCVPASLDPGSYILSQNQYGHPLLSQDMTLDVYGHSIEKKELYIERTIRPLDNPLNMVKGLNAIFFGYEHQIKLIEKEGDSVQSEAWNLLQFNPEGTLYIPTTSPAKYTEYYEPFEQGYQVIEPMHVELKIDAKKRYKVGYKAAITTGRSGYMSSCSDGEYLMIRNFYNDISGNYLKSPVHSPEERGHALHVYNDDGNIGHFAEHECSCTPIGGSSGRGVSLDRVQTMFFIGDRELLLEIRRTLLGV